MRVTPLIIFFVMSFSPFGVLAESSASSWYLPKTLSDENTKVRFELDSTWHLVEGVTHGVYGKAFLKDTADPQSVQVELALPVDQFDTDNSSRDRKLRRVMFVDQHPEVLFSGARFLGECTPTRVLEGKKCEGVLDGIVTLVGTSKRLRIPIVVRNEKSNSFLISGEIPLRWAEFGVEDPSILIARVDPEVKIFFEVRLDSGNSNHAFLQEQ